MAEPVSEHTPPEPYYSDDTVALYVGDMREVLPALNLTADLIVADPPYEETSLAWDRWPSGWLDAAAAVAPALWCCLPLRQFACSPFRGREFGSAGWKLSQDIETEWETEPPDHVTWEKHNGSGFAADRFKRVHEIATFWYQGRWRDLHHAVPRVPAVHKRGGQNFARRQLAHTGRIGNDGGYRDDGTRLQRSVIKVRNMNGSAIHPSEKPVDLLRPLIEYACPRGGLVVDPFAGSGSTLDAARQLGRRAIGVEAHEPYAERAARRLQRMTLESA